MTIFAALREDHAIQRDLIDRLVETSGDSGERKTIYRQLKNELQLHAMAEERYLYVPMIEVDITQEKARHSIAEHHEIDEYLEQLDEIEMSSPKWLSVARDLHHRVHHHLDEEEHEVFQLAGKALAPAMKIQLGEEYRLVTQSARDAA